MLNGWKVIAAHLRRDERTAMRWAAERGMPVHRAPGAGRGSVYAIAEEIDAWLAADRERGAEAARAPAPPIIITPATPAIVTLWPLPRWRQRRSVATALTGAGAMLALIGALTLYRPAATGAVPEPAYSDPAARAMFLQASYDWNRRTPDSLQRATQEYSDAIGRDPRVPAAYVGLANSYLLLREYGSMPEAEAYARAEAAARVAIALSPTSADAQRALAFIAFWWRQDRAAARRSFARAIALKPGDPLTHHWFANALLANGEPQAALREIDIARGLDPAATEVLADRGLILYCAGRRAEAMAALRALIGEQPDAVGPHRSLAQFALFEGRADEFLAESATVARLRRDAVGLAEVARWRAARSDAAALESIMLREAERMAARGGGWFRVAQLAALTGRRDEAGQALARACATREPAAVSAPSDLWLSRAISSEDVAEHCGRTSLLGGR